MSSTHLAAETALSHHAHPSLRLLAGCPRLRVSEPRAQTQAVSPRPCPTIRAGRVASDVMQCLVETVLIIVMILIKFKLG